MFRRDATKLGPSGTMGQFDLIFADPPYGKGLGEKALASAARGGWIALGAVIVLEEVATAQPEPGPEFVLLEARVFGDTVMRFFRYGAAGQSLEQTIVENITESSLGNG